MCTWGARNTHITDVCSGVLLLRCAGATCGVSIWIFQQPGSVLRSLCLGIECADNCRHVVRYVGAVGVSVGVWVFGWVCVFVHDFAAGVPAAKTPWNWRYLITIQNKYRRICEPKLMGSYCVSLLSALMGKTANMLCFKYMRGKSNI